MGISSILGIGAGVAGHFRDKKVTKLANQGFNYLQDNPLVQQTQQAGQGATGLLSGALGLGGQAGSDAAFKAFQDSTGFRSALDSGSRSITGNAAARGELNSGATLKRLNRYGQDLAQQSYGSFLSQLQGLSGAGQQAAYATGAAGSSAGQAAAQLRQKSPDVINRVFGI